MRLTSFIGLLAAAACCSQALAQSLTCTFDDIVGRSDVGSSFGLRDIAVDGNLAAVLDGRKLKIVDITDPANPNLLGQYEGIHYLDRVDVSNGLAFCISYDHGMLIYDISDPSNPTFLSQTDFGAYFRDVQVVDELVFATAGSGGLRAFDYSDPSNPVEVGRLYPEGGNPDGLHVAEGLAIGVAGRDAWIIDVSDPTSMVTLAHVEHTSVWPNDAQIVGSLAFLVSDESGLTAWDISDPAAPVTLGSFGLPGRASRLSVVGDVAFVGLSDRGCALVDIRDPSAPDLIGLYDPQGWVSGIHIADGLAYFATGVGLEIFDISSPPPPALLVERTVPTDGRDIAIHEGHAFVASYFDGLTIFDIANPLDPQQVGSYRSDNIGARARGIQCRGDRAYVAAGTEGMEILDISTPTAPVLISAFGSYTNGLHVEGNLAYLANFGVRLQIYDISDETAPVRLSQTPGGGMCVDVHGDYAYSGWDGIYIHDVSDPTNPIEVARDTTGYEVADVLYRDGYLYAAYFNGALIYDVADPTNPILLAQDFGPPLWYQRSVDLRDDQLWLAGYDGVTVFDASRPDSPEFFGSISPELLLGTVRIHDNHAYFLERREGNSPNSFFVINVAPCQDCPADFDANGTVDTRDFIAFLGVWAAERTQDCSGGDCRTDLDANGVVDTRDFVAFLSAFAAGC